jgi:hypothetical protein
MLILCVYTKFFGDEVVYKCEISTMDDRHQGRKGSNINKTLKTVQ